MPFSTYVVCMYVVPRAQNNQYTKVAVWGWYVLNSYIHILRWNVLLPPVCIILLILDNKYSIFITPILQIRRQKGELNYPRSGVQRRTEPGHESRSIKPQTNCLYNPRFVGITTEVSVLWLYNKYPWKGQIKKRPIAELWPLVWNEVEKKRGE